MKKIILQGEKEDYGININIVQHLIAQSSVWCWRKMCNFSQAEKQGTKNRFLNYILQILGVAKAAVTKRWL